MDFDINLNDQLGSNSPKTNQPQLNINANQHTQPPVQHQYHQQQNIQPQVKQAPKGCTKFCQIQFYQQYFQVTQIQVLQRIKMSLIPIKRDFIENIKQNPDFYGPFWILTTIIFLLGSAGNFASYLENIGSSNDSFKFDMSLVRMGVGIVYPFGFGVPILLYFILKFTGGQRLSLPQLICIYGYSFSTFVIIFILCIIPSTILQWLLMVVGMIGTIAFLALNLLQYLDDLVPAKKYVFLGIVGAAQITLFLYTLHSLLNNQDDLEISLENEIFKRF